MKKSATLLVISAALAGLAAGCSGGGEKKKADGLYLSIGEKSIIENQNFIDGAMPHVELWEKGVKTDVTYYTYMTDYIIHPVGDMWTNYDKKDSLPAGDYTVSVSYGEYTVDNVEFSVREEAPVAGSEGNGFHHAGYAEEKSLEHFDNIGALGAGKFPSTGNGKILVIPVIFSDIGDFTSEELEVVNNAYFGDDTNTGWESLSSFYRKSSYGRLNMSGIVTPQYKYPKTCLEFEKSGSAAQVLNAAVTWLKSNHPEIDMKDYDTNHDGWIDCAQMVYKTNRTNKSDGGDDVWWNYTSNAGGARNVDSPNPSRYFWSLYSYIQNGYYDPNIDTHTLIHETGHTMGLNDYYSYDKDEHMEGAAGCVDMMDMNVGDHNAYSKYMLNWVNPMVVDGTNSNFTIDLHPYSTTGECIILRNTSTDPFNGSPYDEYLMLQYYTPDGLYEKDSEGYPEWTASGNMGRGGTYEKAGLMVFHIDARLYHSVTDANGKTKLEYTDVLSNSQYRENGYTYGASAMAASNTASNINGSGSVNIEETNSSGSTTYYSKYREVHAIGAGGIDNFSSSTYYNTMGNNANLFSTQEKTTNPDTGKEEKVWGGATDFYSNYNFRDFFKRDSGSTWNDGSTLNWSFKILQQSFDKESGEGSMRIQFIETK